MAQILNFGFVALSELLQDFKKILNRLLIIILNLNKF